MKNTLITIFIICLTLGNAIYANTTQTPPTSYEPPTDLISVSSQPATSSSNTEVSDFTANYETSFIKTLLTFFGFVLLIIITIITIRKLYRGKFSVSNDAQLIKILEKRPLSPKSMLYVVEISGKHVLLTESQLEVRAATTIEWESSTSKL